MTNDYAEDDTLDDDDLWMPHHLPCVCGCKDYPPALPGGAA